MWSGQAEGFSGPGSKKLHQSWPLGKVLEGLRGSEGFIGVWSVPFQANEADAVTLDAGLVYEAGLAPYSLKPVVAEFYGSKDSKFSLWAQERVCGPSSLLVDVESCLLQVGNERSPLECKWGMKGPTGPHRHN